MGVIGCVKILVDGVEVVMCFAKVVEDCDVDVTAFV